MSEFWIERVTDGTAIGTAFAWDDGGWVVWHRPEWDDDDDDPNREVVALCETEVVAKATLAGLKAQQYYADVVWTVDDVRTLLDEPESGEHWLPSEILNWTDGQIVEFLQRNDGHIRGQLIPLGWSVLEDLLRSEAHDLSTK